jgi:hypothetical protein
MKHAIKKMAKGGSMGKTMMKDKGAKVPAVAIMIGVAKPKAKTKMATGGMAAFERFSKDVEKKGVKEGSKADMAMDKKQMASMKKSAMAKKK